MDGEILTTIQDKDPIPVFIPGPIRSIDAPPAVGKRHKLETPSDGWWDEHGTWVPNIVEKHYITTVIQSIREKKTKNGCN